MKDSAHPDNNQLTGCMLYVPWQFDMLGGVDVVVDRIASGMDRRSFPCRIWIGEQDWIKTGEYHDKEGRAFISVNLPAPPIGFNLGWLRYAVTFGRRAGGLMRLLSQYGIGVVNCHFPTANVYPLALLKSLGLWRGRLVLSFHGSDVLEVKPGQHLWRTIAGATDAVTAVSASLARQVAETGLWPIEKIHVVPNGIDFEKFTPDRPSPLEGSNFRYVLAVGNFVPLKGHDVLLDAFSKVAARHPDMHLVLAGGAQKGDWLAHLKKCAAELGLDGKIHFLADVPHGQIPALVGGAELFAHPSHREAMGLVLLEAAAMGRAVVATTVGGIPEIIASPDLGRLVPPGDPDQLAKEIDALLDDAPLRNSLGDRLRTSVQSRFSVRSMNDAYGHVLFGRHGDSTCIAGPSP